MKVYVLGFMFNEDGTKVVLIRKTHPEWQAGRFNGVGGKVEVDRGEVPIEAMVREFHEETGIPLDTTDLWTKFCWMRGQSGWGVYCYAARSRVVQFARTMTDEQVVLVRTHQHDSAPNVADLDLLPNLLWLIPMAWEAIKDPQLSLDAQVIYKENA